MNHQGCVYRVVIRNIPQQVTREEFYAVLKSHKGSDALVNAVLFPAAVKKVTRGGEETGIHNNAGFAFADFATEEAAVQCTSTKLTIDGVRAGVQLLGVSKNEQTNMMSNSTKRANLCSSSLSGPLLFTEGWSSASMGDILSLLANVVQTREEEAEDGASQDVCVGFRDEFGNILIG